MDRRTIKNKRSKSRNARPYDRPNQTILGRVASKVKGLLNPSWIFNVSQWMTTPTEDEPGNSNDPVEEEDSDDEDIIPPQPPNRGSKRPRLRLNEEPSILSEGTQTWLDAPSSSSLFDQAPRMPSTVTQNTLMDNKESAALMNGDDHSENSEGSASTSGCSSLVSSHKERSNCLTGPGLRLNESALANLRGELKNVIDLKNRLDAKSHKDAMSPNASTSRISLWSGGFSPAAKFQRRSPSVVQSNQPSFNLGTFVGSPKIKQQTERKVASPFYHGRTSFGGASSTRRMPVSAAPYQVDRPVRNQVKVRTNQSEDSLEGMSSAAKRILLTLEKMSSPVIDAKKMPNTSRSPVDLSLYMMPPKHRSNVVSTPSGTSRGPPIANISTISKLTTLKSCGQRRFQNSNVESLSVPTEDQNSGLFESFQQNVSPLPIVKGGGGKMRSKLTQQHQPCAGSPNEQLDSVPLPNVPLPISTLPTFNFDTKSHKSSSDNSKAGKDFIFSNPIEVLPKSTFSPILHSNLATPNFGSVADRSSPLTKQAFTFSSPIEHELPSSTPSTTLMGGLFGISSTTTWECSSCWIRNPQKESKCLACESPRSPSGSTEHTLPSSSVSSATVAGGFNSNFMTQPSSWKCSACWIQNPSNEATCRACENPKLSESVPMASSTSLPATSVFGSAFSGTSSTWECSSCWVKNPSDRSKCMACENPRSMTSAATAFSSTTLSAASSAWECSSCWVRNPSDKSKCMACENPRSMVPAAASFVPATSGTGNFSNSTATWECSSCWVRNPPQGLKCVACENPKPKESGSATDSSAVDSGFASVFSNLPATWECKSCWVRNSLEATKCVACETPKTQENSSGISADNAPKSVSASDSTSAFGSSTGGFFASSGGFKMPNDTSSSMVEAVSFGGFKIPASKPDATVNKSTGDSSGGKTPANKPSDIFGSGNKTVSSSTALKNNDIPGATSNSALSAMEKVSSSLNGPSSISSLAKMSGISEGSDKDKNSFFNFKANTASSQNTPALSSFVGKPHSAGFTRPDWECDTCSVKNGADKRKCSACETLRPSKDNMSTLKNPESFKFNSPLQSSPITFKFGSTSSTPQTTTSVTFSFAAPSSTTSTFFTPVSGTALNTANNFESKSDSPKPSVPEFKVDAPKVSLEDSVKPDIPVVDLVDKKEDSEDAKLSVFDTTNSKSESSVPPLGSTTGNSMFKMSAGNAVFSLPVSTESKLPSILSTRETQPLDTKKSTEGTASGQTKDTPVGGFNFKIPSAPPASVFGGFSVPASNKDAKGLTDAISQKETSKDGGADAAKKTLTPFSLSTSAPSVNSLFSLSTSNTPAFKIGDSADANKSSAEPSLLKNVLSSSAAVITTATPTFNFNAGPVTLNTTSQPKQTPTAGQLQFQASVPKSQDVKTIASVAPFCAAPTSNNFSFGNPSATVTQSSTQSGFSFFTSTTAASNTTTTPSLFTLGASNPSTQPAKPGGFTFKAPNEEKPKQLTPNVTFSVPATTTASSAIFKFGTSAPATAGNFVFGAVKTEPVSTAPSTFAFGAGTVTAGNASTFSGFQTNQPTATPAFQFGSQPPNNTVAPAAFGAGSGNFSFGNKPETTNQLPTSQAQTTGFGCGTMQPMFGGATAPTFGKTEKPQGFNFGPPAASSPSMFQFGTGEKKQATAPQFQFGTPTQDAQAPNSFAPASFNISTPPTFNFGATSTSAGPFQFAASSTESSNSSTTRKIRKAVRRVRKE